MRQGSRWCARPLSALHLYQGCSLLQGYPSLPGSQLPWSPVHTHTLKGSSSNPQAVLTTWHTTLLPKVTLEHNCPLCPSPWTSAHRRGSPPPLGRMGIGGLYLGLLHGKAPGTALPCGQWCLHLLWPPQHCPPGWNLGPALRSPSRPPPPAWAQMPKCRLPSPHSAATL